MSPVIRISEASFSYNDTKVFSSVSFDIHPGEVLCLLGCNGCGKTTLLRCISGALRLIGGSVQLDNRDLSTMTATDIARRIGFVFQEHSSPFPYSVIDVVSMGRAPHLKIFSAPTRKDLRIAEEALDIVGMYHLRDKPYTQISGGERQLVLIARTITQQPDVILLDEPTSHLDLKNQTLILRMINKLARQGLSVMMSSHLPNHALLYSSKVALMHNGGILAMGNPDEVISEESLQEIYGIEVKIFSGHDGKGREEIKFCMPSLESTDILATHPDKIDNVFEGVSTMKEGLAQIVIGKMLTIEAATHLEGKVRVYLPPEDLIVSKQPMASSSGNHLKGVLKRISPRGANTQLEIAAGERLVAQTTGKSYADLNVDIGADVYVTFRASDVYVFRAEKLVSL
jgi:iron complex transport system ATP-binding protein